MVFVVVVLVARRRINRRASNSRVVVVRVANKGSALPTAHSEVRGNVNGAKGEIGLEMSRG